MEEESKNEANRKDFDQSSDLVEIENEITNNNDDMLSFRFYGFTVIGHF